MSKRKNAEASKTIGRRRLLQSASAGVALSPLTSLFAQTYQTPGVYTEELGTTPRAIGLASIGVGLFVDRFSHDLEESTAHECRSEADLFRHVGKEGSLLFPEAYASARLFFAHGGQQLFVINTPMVEETPNWSAIFANSSALPEANLVYLPTAANAFGANVADLGALYGEVINWCQENYAVLLIDGPNAVSTASAWRSDLAVDSAYAVAYAPSMKDAGCERFALGVGGAAAGVIAGFEQRRGVWKAPAGVEATLVGLLPAATVTHAESASLNAISINSVVALDRAGARSPALWGARTMSSNPADRYLNVHRLREAIKKSVYDGLDWVVFEPNDEPLWTSVEISVGNFLSQLYRQGAFQGRSEDQGFFVRCGLGETMTQSDLDNGRFICEVGFAPLKPAEFVTVRFEFSGLPS